MEQIEQKVHPLQQKILRLFSRHFYVVLIAVIVASAIISYSTIILPQISNLARFSERQQRQVNDEIATKEKQLDAVKKLVAELETARELNTESIMAILPPVEKKEEILFAINDIAHEAGLYVTRFTMGKEVEASGYFKEEIVSGFPVVVVPLNITVKGSRINYATIKQFLHLLYNRYHIFSVSDLKIAEFVNTEKDTGDMFDFRVEVFFRKDIAMQEISAAP